MSHLNLIDWRLRWNLKFANHVLKLGCLPWKILSFMILQISQDAVSTSSMKKGRLESAHAWARRWKSPICSSHWICKVCQQRRAKLQEKKRCSRSSTTPRGQRTQWSSSCMLQWHLRSISLVFRRSTKISHAKNFILGMQIVFQIHLKTGWDSALLKANL